MMASMETEEALGSLSRRGHWRLYESRDNDRSSSSFLSFISLSRLARCSAFKSQESWLHSSKSKQYRQILDFSEHLAQSSNSEILYSDDLTCTGIQQNSCQTV